MALVRIFDIPDLGDQTEQLSYTLSTAEAGTLSSEDFTQITPLLMGD